MKGLFQCPHWGAVLCSLQASQIRKRRFLCHFLFRSSAHESGGTNFHRSADMDFMLLQPFVAL